MTESMIESPMESIEDQIEDHMVYATFTSINSIDEENRTLIAVVSTEDIDISGEIVKSDGAVLDRYLDNPMLLWQHNSDNVPIGQCVELKVFEGRIEAKFKFNTTQLGNEVWIAYKEGGLKAFSIGFMPIEKHVERFSGKEVLIHDKWLLLEISAVTMQANAFALAKCYKDSPISKEILKELGDKDALADIRQNENIDRIFSSLTDIENWKKYCDKNKKEFPDIKSKMNDVVNKLNSMGLVNIESPQPYVEPQPHVEQKIQEDETNKKFVEAIDGLIDKFNRPIDDKHLIGRIK